jgi:hypothetical protein
MSVTSAMCILAEVVQFALDITIGEITIHGRVLLSSTPCNKDL